MTRASPEEVIARVIKRWIPTQARVATNTIISDLLAAGYVIAPKVATDDARLLKAVREHTYMIAASQEGKK